MHLPLGSSGGAVLLGPEPKGCGEDRRGKWFQAPTYPSVLEEMTGILDLFGLRRNRRDPDINSIWGGTEVGAASLLNVDL